MRKGYTDKSVTTPAQRAAIRHRVRTGRYRVYPDRVATAILERTR